jgi:origin recognition complex subunit 5
MLPRPATSRPKIPPTPARLSPFPSPPHPLPAAPPRVPTLSTRRRLPASSMSQPVTPRRTTRSTAGSASDPTSPSSPPKSRPKPSSRRQLLAGAGAAEKEEEGEGKRSVDALLEALPGRRAQAMDLLRLLAPAPALPLLLYGGAATGKTRALLLALRHVRPRPQCVAYAALRSLPSARALFASLLSQLTPASSSSSASSRQRVPDKPSDFVSALRDALAGLSAQGEAVYLVFDNLEVVRSWDKGAQLLALLLRLHELLRLPQVVLVYVSNATPDAYYSMTGSIEPNHIYFPDYTVDEVRDILMRGHPNPKLYSSFLR